MPLRDYQYAADTATRKFIVNERGHGIMSAACGAGKSFLISAAAEYIWHTRGEKVLVLADRAKLLLQNHSKFEEKESVGIVSAGLNKSDFSKPITVAGIQTIYNKVDQLQDIKWLLIDECQAVGNNFESDSRYHQVFNHFPEARAIGYTATPFTLQEGLLSWGKIFHTIKYKDLVEQGYLCPIVNKLCDEVDVSSVPKSGKEYNLDALGELMSNEAIISRTAEKAVDYIKRFKLKKGLCYAVNIDHGIALSRALARAGLKLEFVTGLMLETRRDEIYQDFEHTDKYDCLVNVETLTTGVDFPFVDYIINTRHTESLGLWHQILGRGTRLFEGKENCLLMDFTDNLKKFGGLANPIWEYMGSTKKKIGNPIKICPACEEAIPTGHENCPECGYIFEKEEVKRELRHNMEADFTSDIEKDTSTKYVTINNVLYYKHTSAKGNEFLRIEYQWGNARSSVSEYMPFGGELHWQKRKCLDFIKPRAQQMPETIEEALELCATWRKPKVLRIRKQKDNPKYWELVKVEKWA